MKLINDSFKLTKAEIKALCAFTRNDPTLPKLCVINFNPQLGQVSATDGHTLIRLVTLDRGTGDEFNVSRSDTATLAKVLGPKDTAILRKDGVTVRAVCNGVGFNFEDVDVKFPPVNSVIDLCNKSDRGHTFTVDSKFLARLDLAQKAVKGKCLRFWPGREDLDPLRVVVVTSEPTECTMVVCGMRV